MNKIQKVNLWSFVVGLLFLILCAISLGEENEITSKGIGDLSTVTKATAKDTAIRDALRKAVEQAVGIFISSETEVENFKVISDRIYSKSKGYIKRYKILNEEVKDDQYIVEIFATVGLDDISSDLEAIGISINMKHNPRIMVIMGESVGGKEYLVNEGVSMSETAIIDQFISKGFKVVDAEAAKETIKRNQSFLNLEGDKMLAAKMGLQYDAEIVIMGKATAKSSGNIMDSRIQSIHANLTARAIRTDIAEIIASVSDKGIKTHIDETTGAYHAFEEVGRKLADTLIKKILAKWGGEINLNRVELIISGLRSYSELIEIKKAIKNKARDVSNIYQKSFIGGIAKLEIDLGSDAQTLAETLVMQKISNIELDIAEITNNKIHAKVKN